MLSDCMVLVGLSIAPEPTSSTLPSSPRSMRFISHPQETEATQPQPVPPARVSWSWEDGGAPPPAAAARVGLVFLIRQRRAAVHQLLRRQRAAALAEELQEDLAADPTEVAGGDEVEIIRRRSGIVQMRAYG